MAGVTNLNGFVAGSPDRAFAHRFLTTPLKPEQLDRSRVPALQQRSTRTADTAARVLASPAMAEEQSPRRKSCRDRRGHGVAGV